MQLHVEGTGARPAFADDLLGYESIAVVGATGAVGREALQLLADCDVPRHRIRAFASERSAGSFVDCGEAKLRVEPFGASAFRDHGLALLCADADTARRSRGLAADSRCLLVDNSSAFRLDHDVPLVVPEVNADAIGAPAPRLVANPNCSTILLVVAAQPLRSRFGLEEIVVATYQSVSGAGAPAVDELRAETERALRGEASSPVVFRESCAFNVFSHDSPTDPETGRNQEEQKLIDETRKIFGDPGLLVSPTCVRVPVVRAHTEAVRLRFERPASEHEVREALAAAPSITLVDDRVRGDFPTPQKAARRNDVLVGRIRRDPCDPPGHDGRSRVWSLLLCGDQLRKGAATNALQVAALAARRGLR